MTSTCLSSSWAARPLLALPRRLLPSPSAGQWAWRLSPFSSLASHPAWRASQCRTRVIHRCRTPTQQFWNMHSVQRMSLACPAAALQYRGLGAGSFDLPPPRPLVMLAAGQLRSTRGMGVPSCPGLAPAKMPMPLTTSSCRRQWALTQNPAELRMPVSCDRGPPCSSCPCCCPPCSCMVRAASCACINTVSSKHQKATEADNFCLWNTYFRLSRWPQKSRQTLDHQDMLRTHLDALVSDVGDVSSLQHRCVALQSAMKLKQNCARCLGPASCIRRLR